MSSALSDIRAQFPALARRHNGQPVAYFDGPGGTQVPRSVVDAMSNYLFNHNANTYWVYPTSVETDAAIMSAREALADFLNAAPDEIAFGANMTTLTFHFSRALGQSWGAGDEVVVTELDHHANVDPWKRLKRERGITVRVVRMLPHSGQLDWDDLERSITSRTRLVAIGAASNAIGTITDVQRVTEMAHSVGALVFVDAVHYAPHELVDVRRIGCDYLALSAYKFYGPHLGVLYGQRDFVAALDVPKLEPAPEAPPERLETGTQNHEGIVGAGAAVDFLASLAGARAGERSRRQRLIEAFNVLGARATSLVARLWNGLSEIEGVTLFGPPPGMPRTPTISISVANATAEGMARRLAGVGVFVSHGDFYATTLVERLGQARDGVLRVGCACYTSDDEVERLIEGVRAISTGKASSAGRQSSSPVPG
ncbi:MAG: cysteine desulfurase-like protein [Gemmatimonadaceae bacterium]